MPINFHDSSNRFAYTDREVDDTWKQTIFSHVNVKGTKVLDLGCGGGIYTKTLAGMGTGDVTGLDFSKEMLHTAKNYCKNEDNVHFILGDAYRTGLDRASFDIILCRAVLHHLQNLPVLFKEINHLLKPNGTAILQDRTLQDCLIPGDSHHIRGYIFQLFPKLTTIEESRRPDKYQLQKNLYNSGFKNVKSKHIWEIRNHYSSLQEVQDDLRARTGRSILHELSDEELESLIKLINQKVTIENSYIVEKDRWTIWFAHKEW